MLLARQRAYLERVQTLLADEHRALEEDGTELTPQRVEAALARVRNALEREYPDHRFPVFLNIGLPAEWRRVTSSPS